MSKIEVNAIEPQCGTDLTVGASGDTITFPTGTTIVNNGSQTGFGRTGTVDWQTAIKTSTITVVNGEGYFVNTTGGAITANLPAGSAGAIAAFRDYANTFDSNALTVNSNGSEKINGSTDDLIVSTEGESITLVYADATKGWLVVNDGNNDAGVQAEFVTATGGNTTVTCGNFKTHIFTGPGTLCVSNAGNAAGSTTVDYLVAAGGGGGGTAQSGGGGAGGFRVSNSYSIPAPTMSPLSNPTGLSVSVQGYPIVIGGGGAGKVFPPGGPGGNGLNSTFSTIVSTGGGGGAGPGVNAADGGSGGGRSACFAGNGNTPPVSPSQGFPGRPGGANGSGGGGAGGSNPQPSGGTGVDGSFVSPLFAGSNGTPGPVGSVRYFAGGGSANEKGAGGAGGGGTSNPSGGGVPAFAGTINTGGGGGGWNGLPPGGMAGGSGIVIIRYKFQN